MMSHAHEEVSDMVGIAEALVLNIGTLDPYWVERMKLARAVATPQGLPTLLDPVGAAVQGGANCVRRTWAAASFWRKP